MEVRSIRMKKCKKCCADKPASDFNKRSREKDGLHYLCRSCNSESSTAYYFANHASQKEKRKAFYKANPDRWKNNNLKALYGIDLQTYNSMFLAQEGRCAICETHQSELNYSLVVDHDHSDGEIRGLLCHLCNRGLGMLRDSTELLDRARAYLGRSKIKVAKTHED